LEFPYLRTVICKIYVTYAGKFVCFFLSTLLVHCLRLYRWQ